jgi:hypothetical protein
MIQYFFLISFFQELEYKSVSGRRFRTASEPTWTTATTTAAAAVTGPAATAAGSQPTVPLLNRTWTFCVLNFFYSKSEISKTIRVI